jgi:hypothetical protein
MYFWIDTEFNEYKGQLISMALVADDGREWYEVLQIAEAPRPWVAVHVMPVLKKDPISINAAQTNLEKWLSNYDSAHIVADWPEDIQHFCEFLITGPGKRINTPILTMEIRRDVDSGQSAIPHNALSDARALRLAYSTAPLVWI